MTYSFNIIIDYPVANSFSQFTKSNRKHGRCHDPSRLNENDDPYHGHSFPLPIIMSTLADNALDFGFDLISMTSGYKAVEKSLDCTQRRRLIDLFFDVIDVMESLTTTC
ncbi:hypothetical protein CEXT_685071 [Caerostris extrusa]|uniref:Uncharacterized protein n=1 Tax=Caerostris extrusa TaxID=172846 RepID=A0AAV4V1A0_CAEEX|nr:hypothetical protein CEXT_685071 [Caerostris extrusa]